ncbi:MAG: hypothetical protein KGZ65_08145 [Sphingomonadales bacterium]|nr:hypothetical protein [Sphingomonadaceae bacterium]MBS3931191.1 hypothetical protein [Sphingomonadales bacterium]
MKRFIFAATAALAAAALPTTASAEDKLVYDDLVHCAAFNKVIADVMGSGADGAKNKAAVDTYNTQSLALMAIAAVGADKTAEVVLGDTNKRTEVVMTTMLDKATPSDYIKTNFDKCTTMGKAAVSIVEDSKKGK